MGRIYRMFQENKKCTQNFGWKYHGNRPFRKIRCGWENKYISIGINEAFLR
jgi:hypothetical protein